MNPKRKNTRKTVHGVWAVIILVLLSADKIHAPKNSCCTDQLTLWLRSTIQYACFRRRLHRFTHTDDFGQRQGDGYLSQQVNPQEAVEVARGVTGHSVDLKGLLGLGPVSDLHTQICLKTGTLQIGRQCPDGHDFQYLASEILGVSGVSRDSPLLNRPIKHSRVCSCWVNLRILSTSS